jgi:hypothetical protein
MKVLINDYLDFKFRTGLMFAISVIWYEFLKLGRLHSNRMIGSVDVSDVPILQDSGFESRRSCISCYFLFFLGSQTALGRCKQHLVHPTRADAFLQAARATLNLSGDGPIQNIFAGAAERPRKDPVTFKPVMKHMKQGHPFTIL